MAILGKGAEAFQTYHFRYQVLPNFCRTSRHTSVAWWHGSMVVVTSR